MGHGFPFDILFQTQDLSNLTATQRELLSDRKSWPEMLSLQSAAKPRRSLGSRCHQYLCLRSKTL